MKNNLDFFNAILKADYEKHVKQFNESTYKEHQVVFVGDSLIAYMDTKKFLKTNIINMGIPGDTSVGVIKRLDQIVRIQPSKVLINIGSNDLVLFKSHPDEIVENIKKIVNYLSTYVFDVKIYVTLVTPVLRDDVISNHLYIQNRTNDRIEAINESLKKSNLELVDTHRLWLNGSLNKAYSTDGIHLNEVGYRVYIESIKQALKIE